MARGCGLRAAAGYARNVFGFDTKRINDVINTMLPELLHSPATVWQQRWPGAANATLHTMRNAWAN
jgi:hypothetical protein